MTVIKKKLSINDLVLLIIITSSSSL